MVWPGRPGQPPGEPDPGEETQEGQAGHQAQHAQPGQAQGPVELLLLGVWLRHDYNTLSVVRSHVSAGWTLLSISMENYKTIPATESPLAVGQYFTTEGPLNLNRI